ncbi:MAG TPA: gas vesicle protein [Ktedonobacterales bacterium]|nr:gas vesicle protein [Ktedonobacterales bacterium]
MRESSAEAREVTLLELVDRLLDRGVVLSGDITISVADVDLIELGLRLVLASTERVQQLRGPGGAGETGEAAPRKLAEAAHG